jgi:hypothetical protein
VSVLCVLCAVKERGTGHRRTIACVSVCGGAHIATLRAAPSPAGCF